MKDHEQQLHRFKLLTYMHTREEREDKDRAIKGNARQYLVMERVALWSHRTRNGGGAVNS